jgi:hypothetical protein
LRPPCVRPSNQCPRLLPTQPLAPHLPQGSDDCLDLIAERLPVPASNKRVARWLRDLGIAAPAAGGARGGGAKKAKPPRPTPARAPRPSGALVVGGRTAGGGAAAAAASAGSVPEPQPTVLLGFLEAVEQAHVPGSRWAGLGCGARQEVPMG